ncbi:c-type cytochrome [Pacificoceanicola onchidii]|uniref:c-type cytochrome n=1 Tax=Pacificoceanicola onchidii TaxID=2562685 RepID=UPI0010A2E345|nr:cytochrome c [Pacificoceanicola onchidii]
MIKPFVIAGGLVAAGIAVWTIQTHKPDTPIGTGAQVGDPLAVVRLPDDMSPEARMGERAFGAACAQCHGDNGSGRNGIGPPLVHKIYEPSHHGDESFQRAVALGVRAHHWTFGDMAPVEGFTRADVKTIITYVRTLQRANGIE